MVLNALANILIKVGVDRLRGAAQATLLIAALREPLLYAGVGSFAVALVAYAAALSRLQLSVAYPLMTSVGLLVVAVVSWRWLGETYDGSKTAGTILVIAGVILLTLNQQSR